MPSPHPPRDALGTLSRSAGEGIQRPMPLSCTRESEGPRAALEGEGCGRCRTADGRLVANLMHFARTLRAAGLPVGPGKVHRRGRGGRGGRHHQPRAISTGPCTRCSSTGRTSGSCSTRRFTSSGAIPSCSRRCSALVLPQMNVEMPRDEGAEMIRRLAEALHPRPAERAKAGEERGRDRRGDDLLGPRAAARDGFREDVAGGAGARQGGDRPAAPADPRHPDPPLCAATRAAPAPTCARRCAPRCAPAG